MDKMSDKKEVTCAILSDSKVISSKVSSLETSVASVTMNETAIAELEFDIVFGIAEAVGAWTQPDGKISGSSMGHAKEFKAKVSEVFKMEAQDKGHDVSSITGKAMPKYADLGKLCHPACADFLDEFNADTKSFGMSYHHSNLLNETWSTIWSIAGEGAKVGSATDFVIRASKAKELINTFVLLENNGNASNEVAVKERCDNFISRLYELEYDDLADKLATKIIKDDGAEVVEAKQPMLNDGNKFRFVSNELGYKKTSKKQPKPADDIEAMKTENTKLLGKTARLENELATAQKQIPSIPDVDKVENVNETIADLEAKHEVLLKQADEISNAIEKLRAKQTEVDKARQLIAANPQLLAQMRLAGIALPAGFEDGGEK